MQYDIKTDIANGSLRGEIMYICDYRKPDMDKKPIRHVKPTKVILYTEEDFKAADKKWPTVYYSTAVFLELNKKDEVLWSKHKAPYDNTGYRSFTGTPLAAFSTEEECIEYYNKQVQSVIDRYQHAILNAPVALIAEQNEIRKLLVEKK